MGAAFSNLGKGGGGGGGRMNRSESGSSLMSSMAVNANQIDQVKIERLLTVFNLMQKNDNIMSIVMLTMRELKTLIVSQSIVIFVLTDDYIKGIQGVEEASHGQLFKQKYMLENGKMIDTVANQAGEIKTCFSSPEDIKYGFKDSQYMGYPIMTKDEEI